MWIYNTTIAELGFTSYTLIGSEQRPALVLQPIRKIFLSIHKTLHHKVSLMIKELMVYPQGTKGLQQGKKDKLR